MPGVCPGLSMLTGGYEQSQGSSVLVDDWQSSERSWSMSSYIALLPAVSNGREVSFTDMVCFRCGSRSEVTAQWKKSSTLISIHNFLFFKITALELSCLPSFCPCSSKQSVQWMAASCFFFLRTEGTCSEISCRCDRMCGWWQLIKGDSGAPSEPLRDRGIKLHGDKEKQRGVLP